MTPGVGLGPGWWWGGRADIPVNWFVQNSASVRISWPNIRPCDNGLGMPCGARNCGATAGPQVQQGPISVCLCHLHHQKQDSDSVKMGTQASFGLCGLGAVSFILRGNVLHFYASFIN